MVVPVISGEYPKGIACLFIHQKKKKKVNLITGMPKGRWVQQTLLSGLEGNVVQLFP